MATDITKKSFLSWRDIAEIFDCKRSKALLLMHEIGVVYVGHAVFVRSEDLNKHLAEHGSIDITWPQSKARRKGSAR